MKKFSIHISLSILCSLLFLLSPLLFFTNTHASETEDSGGQTAPAPSQGASGSYTATSNCVITKVGNPPANQPLPAGCSGSATAQKVIDLARAHLKTGTYVWATPPRNWASENPNGNAPTHFDCSGFVGWSWYWGSGGKISMGGQSGTDFSDALNGKFSLGTGHMTTSEAGLQPGDAVYFGTSPSTISHVGLYVGKDPGSSCTANDCFMQYYKTGLPGDEESLSAASASQSKKYQGYIHFNVN